ncbi:DUF883 family protein [Variovorax sp. 38R]|uniref:DUF883 family protein n=1 Tax=Variovorax sp. 38R TaxID=2774875 RepID=UPI00178686B4|nr:DUF883 family protein [Variovorax sp. 38R]QOF76140.1 DUF883 domain-containing protein [Variovorax sp. 38R]
MNSMIPEVATASIDKSNGPSHGNFAIGEQMKGGLQRTRERADALQAGAMRKAREATASTDKAIHHHPYRAVGIAATAALIVGFLAARR